MSSVAGDSPGIGAGFRSALSNFIVAWGEFVDFSLRALGWLFRRRPGSGTLLPIFAQVGIRSVPVVGLTGLFIGMVLAVQSYGEFIRYPAMKGFMGAAINRSVICELGPVLAATMLAGRIGSSIAAQLGTMRVTDQIDAISCLGVNPLHYLVVPRILACTLLIPMLTIVADFMGVIGGAFISTWYFGVEPHNYWSLAQKKVSLWDIFVGLFKSMVFGLTIALASCYKGFRSKGGAEGVGKAATESFVISFVAILVLDFFMAMFFNNIHRQFIRGY